jgi:hypothetical protein
MSAAPNAAISSEQLTSRLGGQWDGISEGSANCPAHDDNIKSLAIGVERKGQILLKCHAGCTYEDIKEVLKSDYGVVLQSTAISLDLYAFYKRLPVDFLLNLGLRDVTLAGGKPAVAIPYYDVNKKEKFCRLRIGMHGSKFTWKKGTKTTLYGLDRLGSNTEIILAWISQT